MHLAWPRAWAAMPLMVLTARLGAGCGSRSPLDEQVPRPCSTTQDCLTEDLCQPARCVAGYCQPAPPVVCDDQDPCTEDLCEPDTGRCSFRPYSYDLDGDGHRAPRPGYLPGAPGSCGDDCNDQSPLARPGGVETCDGLDNDCNGVVDDLAAFVPGSQQPVQVSGSELRLGSTGALTFNGQVYGATYTGLSTKSRGYFTGLTRSGSPALGAQPLTNVGSDSYAGPLVWTGSIFATAWEDRREGNYEIYFNRLDPQGKKLGSDLRVSVGEDFSLHADLAWNGREFLVVWDDQREGEPRIWGQRIGLGGELVGQNVKLTPDAVGESPVLVQGRTRLGLVFKRGGLAEQTIAFRTIAEDFSELGDLVGVSSPGSVDPGAVFSGDRFVVVWSRYASASPGDSIWGATLTETGEILESERRVTEGASFARSQSLLALGDRLLLIWAAEAGDNYDLYTKLLKLDLGALTPSVALTRTAGDAIGPTAAFGPSGDVGVLFDDQSSGTWQSYFTRLTCVPGALGPG
jgi:hypothetical protein